MLIALHLDFDCKTTLQTQIYEQLVSYIRERRLKPGSALPSSRELSKQLGVSRNTVSEAYEKLAADGYINSAPAKGTFVSDAIPEDAMSMGAIRIIERSSPSSTINLPLPYGARGHPGLYSTIVPGKDLAAPFA